MADDRKISFVVHPRSHTSNLWLNVCSQAQKLGFECDVQLTQHPKHAEDLALNAAREHATFVVAVGGDGTAHEVVNGLMEHSVKSAADRPLFGVVPVGSGNDFYRTFDLRKKLETLVQMLVNPRIVTLDLGKVTTATAKSRPRYFLSSVSIGFTAEVVRRAGNIPRVVPGSAVYLAAIASGFTSWNNFSAKLKHDGTELQLNNAFNITIANTRYYGGGQIAAPQADPTDGHLDLVTMELGKVEVIKHIPQTFKGNFSNISGIREMQTKHVSIEVLSDGLVLAQADGEVIGTPPIHVEIIPNAIRFAAPTV